MMMKKKNQIEMAKKIISNVKSEMQKPRLAESVRSDKRDQAAPVLEEGTARIGKGWRPVFDLAEIERVNRRCY
jgi:hypothetical protein